MAKKRIVEKSDEELDKDLHIDFHEAQGKLPSDISRGRKLLDDYMMIPCSQIVPYSGKIEGEDFHQMSESELAALAENIKEHGLMEAISVRPSPVAFNKFEVLAGEHRWRACIYAGIPEIRARVYRDIDDKKAGIIYDVTNLLRREMNFADKCNAWWRFWNNTKQQGLRTDLDETLKQERDNLNLSIRQIQRYVKMHDLIPQIKQAVMEGKVNQRIAYTLAFLQTQEQLDVLDCLHIMTEEKALQLKALSEDGDWDNALVHTTLSSTSRTPRPLTASMSNIRKFARLHIKKDELYRVDKIFEEAMELYFEKHPEVKK